MLPTASMSIQIEGLPSLFRCAVSYTLKSAEIHFFTIFALASLPNIGGPSSVPLASACPEQQQPIVPVARSTKFSHP